MEKGKGRKSKRKVYYNKSGKFAKRNEELNSNSKTPLQK